MKLTGLDPRWLEVDGRRVGLTFLCPHCGQKDERLTCFFEPTTFKQQVILMLPITGRGYGDRIDWVPSKPDFAWSKSGDDFETLTVVPSIDASAAKHWHGFITNGEIK